MKNGSVGESYGNENVRVWGNISNEIILVYFQWHIDIINQNSTREIKSLD